MRALAVNLEASAQHKALWSQQKDLMQQQNKDRDQSGRTEDTSQKEGWSDKTPEIERTKTENSS